MQVGWRPGIQKIHLDRVIQLMRWFTNGSTKRVLESTKKLLWFLYLYFLACLLAPFYARIAVILLPMTRPEVDQIITALVVSVGFIAWWSAYKGGPLLLSEPEVLYALQTSGRTITVSLLTQSVFVGAATGIFCSSLTAMEREFHFLRYVLLNGTGMAVGILIVQLAVIFSSEYKRLFTFFTASVCALALAITVILFGPGLYLLLVAVSFVGLFSVVTPLLATRLPSDRLWERSAVLLDLQSSALMFDLRRTLNLLRSVRDGPRINRLLFQNVSLAHWVWRPLRSFCTLPNAALYRLLMAGIAIIVTSVIPAGGRGSLIVVGFFLLLAATDLTTSLAATTVSSLLHRGHKPSLWVVVSGEIFLAITLTVGFGVFGWSIAAFIGSIVESLEVVEFVEVLGLSVISATVASLQARLGSPNIAKLIELLGVDHLGRLLFIYTLGPTVLWFLGVAATAEFSANNQLVWVWVVLGGSIITIAVTIFPGKLVAE